MHFHCFPCFERIVKLSSITKDKMENHRYTTVVVSSQPMSRSWRHLCYMEVGIAAQVPKLQFLQPAREREMPSSPITQMWPEFPLPEHQPGYREDSVFAFCYTRTLCGICGYRFVFWAVLIQLPPALQSRALRCSWAACSRYKEWKRNKAGPPWQQE